MVNVTYRTLGPWGGGKGANLQPSEVDNNFYSLAQAIVDLQNNPEQPNGIDSITVSGTQMMIYLTDGTALGPYTLPVLTFRWRGEFEPNVYAVLDVFTVSIGNTDIYDPASVAYGIYLVQIAGTYELFDQTQTVGGEPVYLQLFGSTDNRLSAAGDVTITDLQDGDVLRWEVDLDKWINSPLGSMAVQAASAVNITGGVFHNLANPLLPGDAVNKAYVDSLPAGMTISDGNMMSNTGGMTGPAIGTPFTAYLDYVLGVSTRGTLLYRGALGWQALVPGTSGFFLKTNGSGADPVWSVGGSGVTSVAAGAGITTGAGPITASGTVALAPVADNQLLANITGSSTAPAATTLTAFLDHVVGSTRGSILVRAGSGWVALAPGTAGYFLQTQGATADPQWASPSGAGTVTSISAGTGISTGGAPITGSGTVSLAAIATSSVLANISGSSAAPVPATVSGLFNAVFGATQGALAYRNASTWVMLSPGTSGQVLTTGGASANPSWAGVPASAPIANLLLLANISGSSAAAIGNTLSNILDAVVGSSRGMLLYRGASGWAALAAGTSGQVLTTGGTAGDPHWAAGGTGGGASITVSDVPPASPSSGDAWWDGVSGQLFIRVDDGTSSQWVPASNQPGPAGATGAAGTNANMSGMTAGQIPIAATATSVTSSVPTSTFATPASVTAGDALRVLKAGDTMTGDLIVNPGNVGIGTVPSGNLDVRVGTNSHVIVRPASLLGGPTPGVTLEASNDGDAALIPLQLDGSSILLNPVSVGNVGIGTTGPTGKLDVRSTSAAGGTAPAVFRTGPNGADTTSVMTYFQDYGGTVSIGAITRNGTNTVAYGTTSDERLKDDIKASDRGLGALLAIKVSDYRMGETSQQGLLAQQVAEHYPECVREGGDDPQLEPWMIDYGRLTPLLIKAIQDLHKQVDDLRAQLVPGAAT